MTYATESGHWYALDGTPAYTVLGKNGKERNTTLRDARQMNLVPSVTTILKCAAAPGLERWKLDQALDAALTLPRIDGETIDEFKVRARLDSQEQAKQAAEVGTRLHGALESFYSGGMVDREFAGHVLNVDAALRDRLGDQRWSAEKSFASPLGYGGKVDLHSPSVVLDFKSKPKIEPGKSYAYDNHALQLAAYERGLGLSGATLVNVFVGIADAGVSVHIWEPSPRYWLMFQHLLGYWQQANQHFPSQLKEAA